MSSEALKFSKRRGRAVILLYSYHVGYVSLHFLRPGEVYSPRNFWDRWFDGIWLHL